MSAGLEVSLSSDAKRAMQPKLRNQAKLLAAEEWSEEVVIQENHLPPQKIIYTAAFAIINLVFFFFFFSIVSFESPIMISPSFFSISLISLSLYFQPPSLCSSLPRLSFISDYFRQVLSQ